MQCRPGCGACCIAPAISSPLPLSPQGKPAGVPCPHLNEDMSCTIFENPNRPLVCAEFKASVEHCGSNREEALEILTALELATEPEKPYRVRGS